MLTSKPEVALRLARLATSPSVLAALVPLLAPGFDSSAGFAVALEPGDARRLAGSGDARVGDVVAFLTDDPEALALVSRLDLRHYSLNRVFAHPALPLSALLELAARSRGDLPEAVVSDRVAAAVPTLELLELAVSTGSDAAVRSVLQHPALAAPAALAALELSWPPNRRGAPSPADRLLGQRNLPTVLGRSVPGGPASLPVLEGSIQALLSSTRPGMSWFDPGAPVATKVLKTLLESKDLGLGAPVGPSLVRLLAGNPELWPVLLDRTDLSAEACTVFAELLWADVERSAKAFGVPLEDLLHLRGLTYEALRTARAFTASLSALVKNPSCPREVAASVPCNVRDLAPLGRLLPDDPEVWEVAVHLLVDEPRISFGQLVDAATALSRR